MATTVPASVREGFAELGEVRLHYVEAGDGPLVVLLHGFPEFWYCWRHQIPPLADAGFRVVAPDMRGYNLSSKPAGVAAYNTGRLARDIRELVRERGADRAHVVGHDWGAAVAWLTAMNHPEVVDRLAILNLPHPRRFVLEGFRRPRQLAKSWYIFAFQPPRLGEWLCRAGGWSFFRWWAFHGARPGAFTDEDIER
jgi:pimeloyl-ACP methyl ester carboxylesterase